MVEKQLEVRDEQSTYYAKGASRADTSPAATFPVITQLYSATIVRLNYADKSFKSALATSQVSSRESCGPDMAVHHQQ